MISAIDEVQLITALEFDAIARMPRTTRARAMRNDPDFPKPLRINSQSPRSRLKFRLCEVLAWIEQKRALTTAAREAGLVSMDIHLSR